MQPSLNQKDLAYRFMQDADFRKRVIANPDVIKEEGYNVPDSVVDKFRNLDPVAVERAVQSGSQVDLDRPTC
jgi:hypothetical protein